jgi:hypothetical protein
MSVRPDRRTSIIVTLSIVCVWCNRE